MILAAWNRMGLNGPLTQNKVASLSHLHNVAIFGLLETKLNLDRVRKFMHKKFRDWNWCTNLQHIEGGRIMVIWNPSLVDCNPLEVTSQVIHCQFTDKVTSKRFVCSFVHGFNVLAARRDLWSSLISWGINNYDPWILIVLYLLKIGKEVFKLLTQRWMILYLVPLC